MVLFAGDGGDINASGNLGFVISHHSHSRNRWLFYIRIHATVPHRLGSIAAQQLSWVVCDVGVCLTVAQCVLSHQPLYHMISDAHQAKASTITPEPLLHRP
jgi:hypothetical protein